MPNILGSIYLEHERVRELSMLLEAYLSLHNSDTDLKQLTSENFELSWKNGKLTILSINPIKKPISKLERILHFDLANLFLKSI